MNQPYIRVAIADDHPVILQGLDQVVNTDPYMTVTALPKSFGEVFSVLETKRIDVLVLDVSGMKGPPISTVTQIRQKYAHIGIVIFSSSIDLAPELLSLGVHGYVAKEEDLGVIIHAIRSAYAHQQYISTTVKEYLGKTTSLNSKYHLCPQEIKVLRLLSQNLTTKEIAETLSIHPYTVQNYITTLRRKTNCRQRTELVDWHQRMYYGTP